ncbi:unnamed protein product [Discosporangium mesarthrocarpum]
MSGNNSAVRLPLTPIDDALAKVLGGIACLRETEELPLLAARGRVLAADVHSGLNVPPHDNSAMDGYAVRAADIRAVPIELPVSQRIAAGQAGTPLAEGTAARIFTGAPLPAGADAVVMQENTEPGDERVRILHSAVAGENLRAAGEDICNGARLFAAGHRLQPQDIGLLAAAGIDRVSVARAPRVGLLTTGDELVQPGTKLQPGQIYNANAFALSALLEGFGAQVKDYGIVRDSREATRALLLEAAADCDCVVSTGGVSVGEEDHVKSAVQATGHLDLWKLAIKPGKPFASGKLAERQFFGLPGNPVSAFVTCLLLVRPALLAMQGCNQLAPPSGVVQAGFSQSRSGDRQEYLRVTYRQTDGLAPEVIPYDNQSSGVSASLSAADGLAIIPAHTAVNRGDRLRFLPFLGILN